MEYRVKICDKLDWSRVEKAPVDKFLWRDEYMPLCYGQMCVVDDVLHIRLTCHESNPTARCRNFYDEVCEDSTLEIFFGYEQPGDYINCEMNSIGVSLIGVGDGRNGRRRIDRYCEIPKVNSVIEDGFWYAETSFTLEQLKKVFPNASLDPDTELYGNIFKVGEKCEPPHYGVWSEIVWDTPDFHRPECFGKFIITE